MTEADWRANAKELGIKTGRRKKADVLEDIKGARVGTLPSATITQMPGGVSMAEPIEPTIIEPIEEHPKWENDGNPTEVEGFMRRIEALENRVNRIVDAISKSKKVKGL